MSNDTPSRELPTDALRRFRAALARADWSQVEALCDFERAAAGPRDAPTHRVEPGPLGPVPQRSYGRWGCLRIVPVVD